MVGKEQAQKVTRLHTGANVPTAFTTGADTVVIFYISLLVFVVVTKVGTARHWCADENAGKGVFKVEPNIRAMVKKRGRRWQR